MTNDVLEARPPEISDELAGEVARDLYGIDGEVTAREGIGRAVANGMRRRGVLVGAAGPRVNVIKIRPPLVFSEAHADLAAAALDAALAEVVR